MLTALVKARALLRYVSSHCGGRLPDGTQKCVVMATGLSPARVSAVARDMGFPRKRSGKPSRKDKKLLAALGLNPAAALRPRRQRPAAKAESGEVVITAQEAAAMAKASHAEMAARLDAAGTPSFVNTKGERFYDVQAVRDLINIKEDHDGEEA